MTTTRSPQVAVPERFGVERTGRPGSSRSSVGLRLVGGTWRFDAVRIVRQALRHPEPPIPAGC